MSQPRLQRLHVRVDPDDLRELREATGIDNDAAIVRAAVTNLSTLVAMGHEEAVQAAVLAAFLTPGRARRAAQASVARGDF